MTRTWVVGDETKAARDPIEFCFRIDTKDKKFSGKCTRPIAWDNIVLIEEGDQYDIMYAYDDDDSITGSLYLGHWNSGKV